MLSKMAKFKEGETVIIILTGDDCKVVDGVFIAKIVGFYTSGSSFGYKTELIETVQKDSRANMNASFSFHKVWIEDRPYEKPLLKQVNQLIKGSGYERLWSRLKNRMNVSEPFVFR